MHTTARARRAGLVPVVVSVALSLTACGGDDASESDAAASSTAEQTSAGDLASGLLAADQFGPQASVVPITLEQLQAGSGLAASGAEDLQVTPEACAAAVAGTQPDFDEFDDVAAQVATDGSTATVEVLVRGGPLEDAVGRLAEAAERCPAAQVSSPAIGQASITFESLPVDELGDGSALVGYTTTLALPDGTQTTVPTLIGAVQDGDRLLILMNVDAGAATGISAAVPQDPAAFADLLARAYEVQAEALG